MEGNGDMGLIGENFDSGLLGRLRDDDYESRSGSDNFDGASGDELDAGDDQPKSKKKKKYHRHTPQQIQELETFFKECPHPDEKQRTDLSRKLGLANKQVKFWFQNRRTQMKTQLERHENMILRQENEKLRAENSLIKKSMSHPTCSNCGGPAIPGQVSMEEHQIRIENARLKEELTRVCTLSNKFLGRPLSALTSMTMSNPNSGFELGMGSNGVAGSSNFNMSLPMGFDMGNGLMGTPSPHSGMHSPMGMIGNNAQQERSMLIELAMAAMDELIKMPDQDSPLWIKSLDGVKEVLNHEEYARINSLFNTPKPNSYVTEATRATGLLLVNSAGLVDTMLDADRWSEMFPCMIAEAATLDVISSGTGGTRNGAMQLMHAEIQLPSPLVPVRQYTFLRCAKQHGEGVWIVVDVSVDIGRNAANGKPYMSCRKLPSGCILQDLSNGLCKIIWVDHSQYDESVVHQAYRPLVDSGLAFGAQRWVATLQRQCDSLAVLMSSVPSDDPTDINPSGKNSMLKLTQRMSNYFWSGVCPSSASKWEILPISNMGNSDMRIMSRKHPDARGGIVLSAATSVWMPVSRQRLFDFLREPRNRVRWDSLSNGGSMQETFPILKGQTHGNSVSILHPNNPANVNGNDGNVLYLQDSWTDSTGSMIVYSPVDLQSLEMVIAGGDSSFVHLLPSGFSILPDGHSNNTNIVGTSSDGSSNDGDNDNGGCLLTFGLQMLLSNHPTSNLTMESVETVNGLITVTIQKVKDSLGVA